MLPIDESVIFFRHRLTLVALGFTPTFLRVCLLGKMHLEIDMCQKKSFLGEVIHIIELLLRYSFRYFFECSELFLWKYFYSEDLD